MRLSAVFALSCGFAMIFGGRSEAAPLSATIDLNVTPGTEASPVMRVYGDDAGDRLGSGIVNSSALGDVNGDGFDDLVVGAPWADPPGAPDAGEVYVIFGSASQPAAMIDLNSAIGSNGETRTLGYYPGGHAGEAVASGDINGDGFDDLIIGAWSVTWGSTADVGEVYVIYGSASLAGQSVDLSLPEGTFGETRIHGDDGNDRIGQALDSGDLNGDGFDDVIVGVREADGPGGTNSGEVYVIYGSASLPGQSINLNTAPGSNGETRILGDDPGDFTGQSVASGDVNGDGIDDVVVGVQRDLTGLGTNEGASFVIYGSASLPGQLIDLNTTAGTNGETRILGESPSDNAGVSVDAGDVNGDGFDDVVMGAPSSVGKTYVIYGSASLPAQTIDLTTTAGSSAETRILGDDFADYAGGSVSSGDVNGDGLCDVAVGAEAADPPGGLQAGEVYIIYGSASRPATTVDLSSSAEDVRVLGDNADDYLRVGASTGDINRDGLAELVALPANGDNPSAGGGDNNAGAAFVIFGQPSGSTATAHRYSRPGDGVGGTVVPATDFGPIARCVVDYPDDDTANNGSGGASLTTVTITRRPPESMAPLLVSPEDGWSVTTDRTGIGAAGATVTLRANIPPGATSWNGLVLTTDDGGLTWYAPSGQIRSEQRREITLGAQTFPRDYLVVDALDDAPPAVTAAVLEDGDENGQADAGEVLTLIMDRSVILSPAITQAAFDLPALGDNLGGAGFAAERNALNSRLIEITLGAGASLTVAGTYPSGSASAIDVASGLDPVLIRSLSGVPAQPSAPQDIVFTLLPSTQTIGGSGGFIQVPFSPDAAYTQHRLTLPAGALTENVTITIGPPTTPVGYVNALQISAESTGAARLGGGRTLAALAQPATLRLEYRDSDIDAESGQIESLMRVHRIVDVLGDPVPLPLPGPQMVDPDANLVEALISDVGTPEVYVPLAIPCVREDSVTIAPGPGSPVLMPAAGSGYTLHQIEFPGYVVTAPSDPGRIVVTIRTATLLERGSGRNGFTRFFPSSGALFAVTARNATGEGVAFPDPVNLRVQFIGDTPDISFTNGQPLPDVSDLGLFQGVTIGSVIDFQPYSGSQTTVLQPGGGYVEALGVVGLTDETGQGRWGASVAAPAVTDVTGWELYR